jgi:U3 small nucleolar RNA-associated protein 22
LDIKLKFQESRATLPPVFLVTPYDNEKPSICTINKPNMQQLCRTVIMAKQSLNKLKSCIKNFESTENFKVRNLDCIFYFYLEFKIIPTQLKNIFRTKEELYDLVIELKPQFCVKGYQKLDICEGTFIPHYRDWDPEVNKLYPIVDFDPVSFYVRDLREAFEDIALFLYDVYGGSKIYVLWKPDALSTKDLKISNVKSRMICKKNKLDLNVEAVLDDIKIIGKDLVDQIHFRKFKIENQLK